LSGGKGTARSGGKRQGRKGIQFSASYQSHQKRGVGLAVSLEGGPIESLPGGGVGIGVIGRHGEGGRGVPSNEKEEGQRDRLTGKKLVPLRKKKGGGRVIEEVIVTTNDSKNSGGWATLSVMYHVLVGAARRVQKSGEGSGRGIGRAGGPCWQRRVGLRDGPGVGGS